MSTRNIISGSLAISDFGSLGFQSAPVALDGSASPSAVTVGNLINGLITITPSSGGDSILNLPTAQALAIVLIDYGLVVGSALKFTVINNAAVGANTAAIVAVNTNITDGTANVAQRTVEGYVAAGAAANSGAGTFLLRCTAVPTNASTGAGATFTLYRVA
jgi:hypothetical protein